MPVPPERKHAQGCLRIGTRASPLALAQARILAGELEGRDCACELVPIKTSGDRIQDRTLIELGGKGLFTKELEEALLAGTIDCAVHSAKDMPTDLPDGLALTCFLPREDPRDLFISAVAATYRDLPEGAVVGTASLRRAAQILNRRPDLKIATLRGNVQTRLDKLAAGQADATLLALAGIRRLGLEVAEATALGIEDMLPAPAQGAICVETRAGDHAMGETLAPLNDAATAAAVTAERAFLASLDGSCRTPIAALAAVEDGVLTLSGRLLSPDGQTRYDAARTGSPEEAADIGLAAGGELRAAAGEAFFEVMKAAMRS